MERERNDLTTEQYHILYLRAFSRLEDIACQTEQAMQELEELQLQMGDLRPPDEHSLIISIPMEPQKKIS